MSKMYGREIRNMFTFQPWMKTALIIIGVIILLAIIVFQYLLIAGADESRRHKEPTQKIDVLSSAGNPNEEKDKV